MELKDELQSALGDNYRIVRELGGGGMSRVFVAQDQSLDREVVVKVLPPEMSAGVSIERFKREIMLAARLQHAHIVPLLTAGESSGLPFFTMPFVSGESLRARLTQRGELPIPEAVRILREIASALAYAHERGIVHRDIKPDNVLLSGDAAVVTDFGVAKALSASSTTGEGSVTSHGLALGTPAYMAPEQATADPSVDHRADIYAFGVVAYEMLTGATPFPGRTPQALLAAHVTEVPEPIQRRRGTIPPPLAALVMRCLEKRPSDRPQSAAEIVRALDEISVSGASSTTYRALPAIEQRGLPLKWMIAGAALVLLVIAGVFFQSRSPASAASSEKSVAVFPFDNASGDTSMAFFADGMADDLASELSQAGVKVAGRASVAAVQAKHSADQEAGRLLGVQTLLHGSVRRSGSRLRVWTQLVNGSDGIAMWTRTYDTTLTDVFHVQDEIARAIVAELRPSLGAAPRPVNPSTTHGTTDFAAYDLYMQGRYYADRFESDRAIKALTSAVAKDPEFARAYAALARAYSGLTFRGVASPDSIRPLERKAAERALQIDGTLADSHAAMGFELIDEWRFPEAEAELEKAIALDPNNPDTHFGYAGVLFLTGRMSEALVQSHKIRELDPLSIAGLTLMQYCLEMLGRLDDAREQTRRGFELDSTFVPLHQNAGVIAAFSGKPDSALVELKRAYDLDPQVYGNSAYLLFGYAVAGKWSEADKLRAEIEKAKAGNSPNFFKAVVALVYGDREAAITAVERGFKAREPLFLFVTASCDPTFDLIKNEPRFRALMQAHDMKICPPFAPWPIKPKRSALNPETSSNTFS